MLSGGSLEAVDLIQKETASCKATADLLNIILVKDRGDAKDYLISELGFSENDAEEIVKYSHPNVTRPIYLVFSDEMMASLEAIGYFGLWDFEDEYIPEVSFDYEIERVIYPDVISESLIVKMYENEPISGFKEVYSNDTASVYRIE